MADRLYSTSLAKGQGMIQESLALLALWEQGMSAQELASLAIQHGTLGRATAKRAKDMVVEQFGPRFLVDGTRPARQIKTLLECGIPPGRLKQVLLIHTARANVILRDYICDTYWPKYEAGADSLSKTDAIRFLESAGNLGRLSTRWSDTMMSRVASYLGGTLADFGLLENGRRSSRRMVELRIETLTSLYLAHDVHFAGLGDNSVVEHPDWRLFGLQSLDVIRELQRVSNGHFITQYSGDLVRISWSYGNMEEALRATAAAEL